MCILAGDCGANSTCRYVQTANTSVCTCPEGQRLDKHKNCQFVDYCQCDKTCTDTLGCNKVRLTKVRLTLAFLVNNVIGSFSPFFQKFTPTNKPCKSSTRCSADHMLCKPLPLGNECICEWGFKMNANKTQCISAFHLAGTDHNFCSIVS